MVENRVQSCSTKFSGTTEFYPISVVLWDNPINKVISIELSHPNDVYEVNIYSLSRTLQKNKLTDVPCLFYYIESLYGDAAFKLN